MRTLIRSSLLGLFAFLPALLLGMYLELRVYVGPSGNAPSYDLSAAGYVYAGLTIPVLLGAVAHAAAVISVRSWGSVSRWLPAALTPIVPLVLAALIWPPFLLQTPWALAIATMILAVAWLPWRQDRSTG